MSTSTTVLLCGVSASHGDELNQALGTRAQIHVSSHIEEAMERVLLDPELLLLLIDARWPAFDGARLIARVRRSPVPRLAELPIFLLDSPGFETTTQSWLREGADALLANVRGLRSLFDRVLTQRAGTVNIDLRWQSSVQAGQVTTPLEPPSRSAHALPDRLPIRLRDADHWQTRSGNRGALKLSCSGTDALVPLSRLAQELQQHPEYGHGWLEASWNQQTYRFTI